MSKEKMREKFEDWARKNDLDLSYRNYQGQGQFYTCARTLLAFDSWQAALASVEVELPETPNRGIGYGLFERGKEACREAIEAAGLKVKE